MRQRTLTAIGLPIRLETLIKAHLQVVNARTADAWSFSDDGDCDVAICDPESPVSSLTLRRSQKTGSPVCISLVDAGQKALKGTLALNAPLRVAEIIELLDRVSTGFKPSPDNDAIFASHEKPASQKPATGFDFATKLHELVRSRSVDIHVFDAPGLRFCVIPSSSSVMLQEPLTDAWLDHTLEIASKMTIRVVPSPLGHKLLSAFPHRGSINRVLWHAGMKGAQATHLSVDADDATFALIRWPDFGNLPHAPMHRRMAAGLSRRRMTLAQLAQTTHVPIVEVQRFANACAFCGLLRIELRSIASGNGESAVPVAAQALVPPRQGFGFLQSIRNALGMKAV